MATCLFHLVACDDALPGTPRPDAQTSLADAGTASDGVAICLSRLAQLVEHRYQGSAARGLLRYSVGVVGYDPNVHPHVKALLKEADARMYQNKASRR